MSCSDQKYSVVKSLAFCLGLYTLFIGDLGAVHTEYQVIEWLFRFMEYCLKSCQVWIFLYLSLLSCISSHTAREPGVDAGL